MGGNRKEADKRRQSKAAAKTKARKTMIKKTPSPTAKTDFLDSIEIGADIFSDEDWLFWVCHGINCIISDMSVGTWTPMFDDIYGEWGAIYWTPLEVTQAVMDKYNLSPGAESWPNEAKSALSWAVQDRKIVYMYYRESLRRLTAAHGGDADIEKMARAPHNPLVWALFDFLKGKIANRKH